MQADKKTSPTEQERERPEPPFVFYSKFVDDWEGFSTQEKKAIMEFLQLLQEKYDDPECQRGWEQNGKYWAALIPEVEHRVFWTVVYTKRAPRLAATRAEEIHILAVEPVPGEDRRIPAN
jgi:hypothetical protein